MALSKKQYQIINQIINELNINKNDKIHISLDLMKIQLILEIKKIKFIKLSEILLKLIIAKVGKNGIVAVPVFNFECIKSGVYDRVNSPGQTGSFGNLLLKKHYKKRSDNPINSFLIFGKNGSKLIKHKHQNCHGHDSLWKEFINKNFKLITIGHHYVRSFTVIHYLERVSKVNYRFDKVVNIKYKVFKKNQNRNFSFFARKIDICDHSTITFKCDKVFLNEKISKFFKFKKLICFSVDLKRASNLLLTDLKRKKPELVLYTNKKKKINNVLDFTNVIKLEDKYKKLS